MKISITHTLVQKWGESDLYLLRNYLFKLLYLDSSCNLSNDSVCCHFWDMRFVIKWCCT